MVGPADAGANIDIKKSSYKKLSKLLSTFEKKVSWALPSEASASCSCPCAISDTASSTQASCFLQGLLTTKVIHKQDKLTAVNRSHELYTSYAPREQAAASSSSAASTSGSKITVTYSYRSAIPAPYHPSRKEHAENQCGNNTCRTNNCNSLMHLVLVFLWCRCRIDALMHC